MRKVTLHKNGWHVVIVEEKGKVVEDMFDHGKSVITCTFYESTFDDEVNRFLVAGWEKRTKL